MDPSDYNTNVIHETPDFQLELGVMKMVPEPFRDKPGYLLRNKRTNVVEKEGFSESDAIRAMWLHQQDMDRVLADPKGDIPPEDSSGSGGPADFLKFLDVGGEA